MKKANKESIKIAHYISDFLNSYAPTQKTASTHTLKSYRTALSLYITFLEKEKEITSIKLNRGCFSRLVLEEWVSWLKIIEIQALKPVITAWVLSGLS